MHIQTDAKTYKNVMFQLFETSFESVLTGQLSLVFLKESFEMSANTIISFLVELDENMDAALIFNQSFCSLA